MLPANCTIQHTSYKLKLLGHEERNTIYSSLSAKKCLGASMKNSLLISIWAFFTITAGAQPATYTNGKYEGEFKNGKKNGHNPFRVVPVRAFETGCIIRQDHAASHHPRAPSIAGRLPALLSGGDKI